ncbi:hypothetical protein Clacol_005245 [Clathrus columnatus]|uniref:Aminoglycoside phosphotransferase domain-containing protein n=1 Tax=Clathrus columnatus TaxID=1419009 RepID=A0AAV5AES5_9AGAM|nr:hypothetical protein Clacol_005245 [Clathrus columnatus]
MTEFTLKKPKFTIPRPSSKFMIRLRGIFHEYVLRRLVRPYGLYCKYFNKPYPYFDSIDFVPLPFNTVLKSNSRVHEGEALAMSLAHSLGLPAPRMISYGDDGSGKGGSIWMSCLEGEPLNEKWQSLTEEEITTIVNELDQCLIRLRQFPNPKGEHIGSLADGPIPSFRVSGGVILPAENKRQFLSNLIGCHKFEGSLSVILDIHHDIVLTHGDLYRHNILVKDGHLSGIVDWECGGWLPEYWDYTTMLFRSHSVTPKDLWNKLIEENPGFTYVGEFAVDYEIIGATEDGFPI